MNWTKYKKKFISAAKKGNYGQEYIDKCLDYAQNLSTKNLPIIYDQHHFAALVGYDISYLLRASNCPNAFYREFSIPKKTGELRTISEPLPSLKEIQRWILDNILYNCEVSRFAKAFVPNRNIKENARFHRNQEFVLTVDIKNFFNNIKYYKVFSYFKRIGYSSAVSVLLAKLCTLNKCLPQGAPTSPALSNLISLRIDKRLSSFATKEKIRYTRYADDITLSGKFQFSKVMNLIKEVLSDEKLELNHVKTRLMKKHQRQEVTGIVVNEKLQAPRLLRRKLRQQVYYIKQYGLEAHIMATGNTRANFIEHLKGVAQFIVDVNINDEETAGYLKFLKEFV